MPRLSTGSPTDAPARESELARLIRHQHDDDLDRHVQPEHNAKGEHFANATDLRLDMGQTSRSGWRRDLEWLDFQLDRGTLTRWLDDPACRWLGEAGEEALYHGMVVFNAKGRPGPVVPFPCPVCEDRRPKGVTCPYCLREGQETRLPPRRPTPQVVRELGRQELAKRRSNRGRERAG